MARFVVVMDRGLHKDLRRIARAGRRDVVERVFESVPRLEEDPVSPRPGLDIIPLKGREANSFRLRIGEYRVLYQVFEETHTVIVTTAYHRSRGYRP